jgi:hypothetical protein
MIIVISSSPRLLTTHPPLSPITITTCYSTRNQAIDIINRRMRLKLRAFHAVLRSLLLLHRNVVVLPSPEHVNPIIRSDLKLFPWFKDALGAVDGSHSFCSRRRHSQSPWRNRKGFSPRIGILLLTILATVVLGSLGTVSILGVGQNLSANYPKSAHSVAERTNK